MALTSLESISEKLVTKRQSDLESILSISGSAVTTKNLIFLTVFNVQPKTSANQILEKSKIFLVGVPVA